MRAGRLSIASVLAVLMANVLLALGARAAEPVKVVVLEPGSGVLETLLRREVVLAAQLGKVPFVQMTAEWCGPCKKLRASLDDPLMRDAFAGTYLIQVDVDAWKAQLKAAGFDHPAIPVFFAVDELARPTGALIDGGAWGEDIPPNMAPPLKGFFTKVIAQQR
jgi:thiol-disulfide isomerase/thioredoxin